MRRALCLLATALASVSCNLGTTWPEAPVGKVPLCRFVEPAPLALPSVFIRIELPLLFMPWRSDERHSDACAVTDPAPSYRCHAQTVHARMLAESGVPSGDSIATFNIILFSSIALVLVTYFSIMALVNMVR